MTSLQGALGAMAVAILSSQAFAFDVLWDQSNYDLNGIAVVDQDFIDFPPYSSFMAVDVHTGPGWRIGKITAYFTHGYASWPTEAVAFLNVFPKTGPLPDDLYDPRDGDLVEITITGTRDVGVLEVTAEGLDLQVARGEHWIGLTPSLDWGSYGKEFHYPAPIVGADTAWRNPEGGFGEGTTWTYVYSLFDEWQGVHDAAILIEGVYSPDCVGDLDYNGQVGLEDLSVLLSHYATFADAAYEDGDVDFDDDVDIRDLSIMLSAFGEACE